MRHCIFCGEDTQIGIDFPNGDIICPNCMETEKQPTKRRVIMSEWIECDNVKALEMKMKGYEVQFYIISDWMDQVDYDFSPTWPRAGKRLYRYKEKPEFKGWNRVLYWQSESVFQALRFVAGDNIQEINDAVGNKIIPLQSEIVDAYKVDDPMTGGADCLYDGIKTPHIAIMKMLEKGERGRFMILRIPNE